MRKNPDDNISLEELLEEYPEQDPELDDFTKSYFKELGRYPSRGILDA